MTEQRTKQQILAELVREEKATAPINVGLLDLVPQTDIDITGLPEDQQRCLCDAFHGGGTAGGDRDADDHFSGERVVAQLHSRSLSSASSIRATTTTRRPKQMF